MHDTFSQISEKVTFAELDELLTTTQQQGDFENMRLYAEKGSQLALAANENRPDTIYTTYIITLGLSYEMLGMYDEAYTYYNKAKDILEQIVGTKHPKYAQALANLAAYYWSVIEYQKAEVLYLKAQKICRNSIGENNEIFASIQNDLALLYHSMGEYDEAEILYLKNLEYDKKFLGEQDYNYAYSLNNLASLYWVMGQHEKAEPLFLEAKEIWRKTIGKESPDYSFVTNNLANLYMSTGQYQKAAKLYAEALKIDKATYGENHPSYALSLSNSAASYSESRAFDKAEELYLQAQKIWIKKYGPKDIKSISALHSLGNLYTEMKDFVKAEATFAKALQLLQEGQKKQTPFILNFYNFSRLYYYSNQQDSALAYGIASLVYNTKSKLPLFDVFPKNIQDFRLSDELITFCKQLTPEEVQRFEQLDNQNSMLSNDKFTLLLSITKALYKQKIQLGFKEEANKYLLYNYQLAQTALYNNEKNLMHFSEDNDKLGIVQYNITFATFGMDAAKLLGEEQYLRAAFTFTEQNKSILLAEAFQGEKAQVIMGLPDSIAQQEAALKAQKAILQKEQYEAGDAETLSALRSQQNQLSLTIDDFLKMIEKEYPKYHTLKYKNIISTTEEIQQSLDSKTALLEYFITDSITFLFTITDTKVDIIPIPFSKKTIHQKTKQLRKALTNYQLLEQNPSLAYKNYTTVAHWFYKNLVAPGLQEKTLENLIVISDGALGHLPFEAFLTKYTQGEVNYSQLDYLIKEYNISYSYSATLWKENLKMPKKANNQELLACAADYYPSDSTLLDIRSFYDFKTRSTLQALPAAEKEVQTLSKDFKGLFLTGAASTEANFKKNAADYSVIHLAMHGILHPRQPILSSLAFTENRDSSENNFLQAYEIAHLKLNADLVVLSACETGYGEFEQGEGILSLARSFMYAGTPSLIVSLWQVNDQSTAILMKSFYTYLSQGYSKDRALSQAKLDYINQAQSFAAHPAFWSPFIQLGDASPIQLKTKQGSFPWLFSVLLGLCTLLFALYWFWSKKRRG